ncbi:MAG: sulfur carrier protein ThiS [Pseudomonadota bacterium]
MQITLNGKPFSTDTSKTIQDIIEENNLPFNSIATVVNGNIISKERRAAYNFRDGDSLDIIHAVGGG